MPDFALLNDAPIGIFDSGVGGLSVWRAIRALLPHESLIYFADSHYAPYGKRSDDFIIQRTLSISRWLIKARAKAIVVACNTATVHTIALLRDEFKVPIIGVEPGLKLAAQQSVTGVVGVLATASTLQSAKFRHLLAQYTPACLFICQAGHGLVEAIERGDTRSSSVISLLETYLTPMLEAGADTLVLGSTHYTFLSDAIRQIVGERLTLIETGEAIARQLDKQLSEYQLHTSHQTQPLLRFCSSATHSSLPPLLHQELNLPEAEVECINIPAPQFAR